MRTLIILLLVCTKSFGLVSYSEEQYPYPIPDGTLATLTASFNHELYPYEEIELASPRSDRSRIPQHRHRDKILLGLFKQKKTTAPLAFVIAGTGGSGLSGSALMLASYFYAMGYTAITLPDPLYWGYSLSISESGIPGFAPQDAPEYYQFLEYVRLQLKTTHKISPRAYAVAGVSYGALLAGFLTAVDDSVHSFNFMRVLMVNPATDVMLNAAHIDSYYSEKNSISLDRRNYIYGAIYDAISNADKGLTLQDLQKLIQKVQIKPNEMRWLIGDTFKKDLSDLIFTSQQVHDLKILKTPNDRDHRGEYEAEAKEITFLQYITDFVAPTIRNLISTDLKILNASASIYALENTLKSHSNLYLMTNADDFLLVPEAKEFLAEALSDRFIVYPHGGHVGNLWFETNRRDIVKILAFNEESHAQQRDQQFEYNTQISPRTWQDLYRFTHPKHSTDLRRSRSRALQRKGS